MKDRSFLNSLSGEWRFDRTVSLGVSMAGTATFTRASENTLRYHEAGKIHETQTDFTRAYDYVVNDADLAVFYADGADKGKLFLKFPDLLKDTFPFSGCAEHLCGKDRYAALFTFASAGQFATHYEVRGPHKRHSIMTEYFKQQDNPAPKGC